MKTDKDQIYAGVMTLLTRTMSNVENPDWAIKATINVFRKVYGREPVLHEEKDEL